MLRKVLRHVLFIHFLVLLGLAALWGTIASGNQYLIICVALSFAGAVCGAFIRVIDAVRETKQD